MDRYISISQPGKWAQHAHFKIGRPLRENVYESQKLTEGMGEIRIEFPFIKLRNIPKRRLLPFNQAPAQLILTHPGFSNSNQVVKFKARPATDVSTYLVLTWVVNRWIALYQERVNCPYCDFSGEKYTSAFFLDVYGARKILEAYQIPEGILTIEEVQETSPADLALIGKYGSRFIEITYQRGYYDHYDPDPPGSVKIPLGGELPPIPDFIRDDYLEKVEVVRRPPLEVDSALPLFETLVAEPFSEGTGGPAPGSVLFQLAGKNHQWMQLRWVPERREWVAIAYGMAGFTDHSEWYTGPFALDEYCVRRLLQAYNLGAERLTQQELVSMSPFDLVANSFK